MSKDRDILQRLVKALEPITTDQVDFYSSAWEIDTHLLDGEDWGRLILRIWQEAHNHLESESESESKP